PEAESALIAAMLNDSDGTLVDQALAEGLRRDSFHDWRLGAVYDSMIRLRRADMVPDSISVAHDLKAHGELDRCGGVEAVIGMGDSPFSLVAFKNHLELVLVLASQRAALKHLKAAEEALKAEHMTRGDLHE